ncbi:MAG: ABC transporter permease [Lachnospiraceae bacterium]|nr:ABC transporter permease [Lachnospiraceae bacterium]
MKRKELLRPVWMNMLQNKFKVVLTSVGIIIGAATIVMVIAIGQGGQEEVAQQFKNLNAGAIDISYELANSGGNSERGGSMQGGGSGGFSGGSGGGPMAMPGGSSSSGSGKSGRSGDNSSGDFPGGGFMMGGGNSKDMSDRMNQEKITLSETDVEDLEVFVPNISSVSISYTTKSTVDGGELEEETSYTIAGVKSIYANISNLSMQVGEFVTEEEEEQKEKVCVLGSAVAKEIFENATEAYDSTIYIDGRPYIVNGVLEAVGAVSSGISPDEAIFMPYSTGMKYITGNTVSPTITVIAEDLENIDETITNIETVLAESYPNAEFTIDDAGSKMEAASKSNETLTTLLFAMAFIVFLVGGIGIMNVLFVSVKERTKEIGILKAIGCSRKDILMEFLLEACFISVLGGILGIVLSFAITPIVKIMQIPVVLSATGMVLAVMFAVITGTVFGFYPAWKASRLVPVEALSEE